jgi:hypothetical protein
MGVKHLPTRRSKIDHDDTDGQRALLEQQSQLKFAGPMKQVTTGKGFLAEAMGEVMATLKDMDYKVDKAVKEFFSEFHKCEALHENILSILKQLLQEDPYTEDLVDEFECGGRGNTDRFAERAISNTRNIFMDLVSGRWWKDRNKARRIAKLFTELGETLERYGLQRANVDKEYEKLENYLKGMGQSRLIHQDAMRGTFGGQMKGHIQLGAMQVAEGMRQTLNTYMSKLPEKPELQELPTQLALPEENMERWIVEKLRGL